MITKQSRLANLVAQFPDATPVLEEWGIDYVAKGNSTLEQACEQAELCCDEVLSALGRAREASGFRDLSTFTRPELVSYLRNQHHAYLREKLAPLKASLAKVARTYGAAVVEIRYIEGVFDRLSQDLNLHLWKEELFAFPWLSEEGQPDSWVLDTLAQGRRLTSFRLDCLRYLTNQYQVPPEAGPSYHELYSNLRAFEKDVRQHVTIEDNLLFGQAA